MNDIKMENAPFFSVITPTFNRPQLLQRAINSVVKQEFNDLEFIVINDGSSMIYDEAITRSASISKYIYSKKTLGVAHSRNIGILEANGEWVVFLDDDDELAPGYLHHLKEYIDDYVDKPAFIWAAIETHEYDENGKLLNTNKIDHFDTSGNKNALFESAIEVGTSYGFAVNRRVFARTGIFDASYPVGEDTELIIRLLSYPIEPHFTAFVGVIKHDHRVGRLSFGYEKYSRLKIFEMIFDRHSEFFLRNPALYLRHFRWCVRVHYKNCNFENGDRALQKLFSKMPFNLRSIDEYLGWKLFKYAIKYPMFDAIVKKFIKKNRN